MYPKKLKLFLSENISNTDDGRVLRDLVFQGHIDHKLAAEIIVSKRPELKQKFDEIFQEVTK